MIKQKHQIYGPTIIIQLSVPVISRRARESLLTKSSKNLGLQLVRQRDGPPVRIHLLLAHNVRVARAAATGVVVCVLGAGTHSGFGDHILVGSDGRLLARVADVGGAFFSRKRKMLTGWLDERDMFE
jgi:hypothetical protein